MWQDAVGDPWTPEQALEAAADAIWIDVCALTRTDFPPETLAALDPGGRQLLVDLQGLVRTATVGPLKTDANIGDVLRYVEILKLNDEEARTLVGGAEPELLHSLGVPEVILTLGSQGAWVVTPDLVEYVPAAPVDGSVDPTGAGDTYSVTYLVQRAAGAEPVEAARVAAATVSAFLAGALETKLAARDDDRAAAAEHARDLAIGAVRTSEERRGTTDLDALRDLDPLAPLDEPVAAEMTGERTRGRAGRRGLLRLRLPERTCASSTSCPSPRSSLP